ANALRWSTLYNFRFDADVAPAPRSGEITIGLFKTGDPASVSASTIVPGVPAQPCPSDVDGNHTVNTGDLLAVINNWGACPPPCPPACSADVTQDCTVNTSDLLAVINAWGPCQ